MLRLLCSRLVKKKIWNSGALIPVQWMQQLFAVVPAQMEPIGKRFLVCPQRVFKPGIAARRDLGGLSVRKIGPGMFAYSSPRRGFRNASNARMWLMINMLFIRQGIRVYYGAVILNFSYPQKRCPYSGSKHFA
jgi:hypothetical protein